MRLVKKGDSDMQQLGGLDNLMIGGDIPNIPLHMSALMMYDTGGKKGTNALFNFMQENFEEIVDRYFPILKCRIEELPLQMDKAYWVEDPHFTINYHVTRVALPKPQNWHEIYRLIGQFHAQPLDRSRPLWQAMVVEGLDRLEGVPRGSAALFFKIHHAVMDGKSAQRLITSLHSAGAEPESAIFADSMTDEEPVDKTFQPPSWWEKYGRAWWHSVERPMDMASTLVKLLPHLLQPGDPGARDGGLATPQIRFNQPVAADRIVGHVRMDMQQVRKIASKYHCTINDIALCVVAGALRQYLVGEDELPDENLQTLMPIDIRREGKDGHIGNHVSVAKVCLHTVIDDAKKRLRAINADSSQSKVRRKKSESHAILKLVDDLHPAIVLWLGHWLVSSGRIDKMPSLVNTVVTNVPGMSTDAYLAGAKLIDYIGFGPLAPNIGLFHTVSSTPDHVNISFLSTEEFMGGGKVYTAALVHSWTELGK